MANKMMLLYREKIVDVVSAITYESNGYINTGNCIYPNDQYQIVVIDEALIPEDCANLSGKYSYTAAKGIFPTPGYNKPINEEDFLQLKEAVELLILDSLGV